MSIFVLGNELYFPPLEQIEPDGLVAVGGDLSVERLLLAYRNGIFPWYEGKRIMWWNPDPRFILFPNELKVTSNMERMIRKEVFEFTINKAFTDVITNCKTIARRGQDNTWITDEVREGYIKLHEAGYAHSAESWLNGELVGGLYGVRIGKVFFGESMFSKRSDASKYAFIRYVRLLQSEGVELIDCQVYTQHLQSLGARLIYRDRFLRLLAELI